MSQGISRRNILRAGASGAAIANLTSFENAVATLEIGLTDRLKAY